MIESAIQILWAGSAELNDLASLSETLGTKLIIHDNLSEAYEPIRTGSIDILLMDLDDAPMEKLTFLKSLFNRQLDRGSDIFVFASSELNAETRLDLIRNGVEQVLSKPADLSELTLHLQRCMQRIMALRKLHAEAASMTRNTNILGRYFSPHIKDYLLNLRPNKRENGISTFASVMLFDLNESDTVAHEVGSEIFAKFLSSLFEGMAALIQLNHGSVIKYQGNGLLATFGYPVFYNNDIYNSVKCALEIRNFIIALNQTQPTLLKKMIEYGIGIGTGKIFAGNIGASDHKEHRIFGDPVIQAGRLQAMTKHENADILVDAETDAALNHVLTAKQINFLKGISGINSPTVYAAIKLPISGAIATTLSDAELASTYTNKIGDVDFF